MTPAEVHEHTILRVIDGSKLYGTNVSEGLGDRDEVGVCIEPPQFVFGLESFEQYIYRDAVERARAAGQETKNVKSQPGDLDLTIYSLRKFMRLVVGGNPSLLLTMFAPDHAIVKDTPFGQQMRALAPAVVCRSAGGKFLNYMINQRERLVGTRGQKDVNRPELVEKYGFDTKYAGHVLRLGLQGVEMLETGHISLPMRPADRQRVLDVRTGRYTLAEVIDMANGVEDELRQLLDTSALPWKPDMKAVSRFLVDVYPRYWTQLGPSTAPTRAAS